MEIRNLGGCWSVIKLGAVSLCVWRGNARWRGNRWGAGVFLAISRVLAASCRAARQTEGEGVTDIQQVVPQARSGGRGFRAYSAKHLDSLVQRAGLPPDERLAVRAVATVLPFRTNSYVVENLIDWEAAPDDPI